MANPVEILAFIFEMNGLLHVNILTWISGPYLIHRPTVVLFQYKVLLQSLWWLCTCLPVLLWCVGYDILMNILPHNHQEPRWRLLGDCRVSIILSYCLRHGIHKVLGVGQGHHVRFVLLVGVHKYPWLPVQICIHCAPCPWSSSAALMCRVWYFNEYITP